MTAGAPPRAGVLLATLILGATVANLNLSVANVALPTIGRDLDATQGALDLVALGFSLGLAATVLYLGAIADRYGRRRLLVLGLAASIPAAALAAFSPNAETLAAARVLGGIAAGMAFPTTLSIITALFRDAAQTRAIALWTGIGCGASALGPITAGFLLERFWWGSVFIVTIPIALVALVLALWVVPRRCGEEAERVDHLGGVVSFGAIGVLTLGLHFVAAPGDAAFGGVLLALAILGIGAFAIIERRVANPLFDLAIARRRIFWVAALAGVIVFGSLIGVLFIAQQYLQNVLGYSALEAGAASLPLSIAMVAVSPIAARMIGSHGSRRVMLLGYAGILGGFALMFLWREGASYLPVALAFLVMGVGVGMAGAPASRSLMAVVPVRRAGMGSGTTDLQRDLGAAIMQALLGGVLTARYAADVEARLAGLPADQRAQVGEETASQLELSFGVADVVAQRYPQYADEIMESARQAFTGGASLALTVAIVAVAAGLVLVAVAFPGREEEQRLEAGYAAER